MKQLSPLKKQLVKFTIIGMLAVLVDLASYYALLAVFPERMLAFDNEVPAKTLSFICGFFVTYTFNKRWTWKQHNRSRIRLFKFLFLYGISLLLNVGINSLALFILENALPLIPHAYFWAFIAATGTSAVFNFAGQKFWVFAEREAVVEVS